jgi:flagellar assembly protein FliH
MSCRIVTGRNTGIGKLRLPGSRLDPVPGDASDPPGSGDPSTPGEIAELHNRIVDLERALQRDVRNARESGFRDGEKAGREQASADVQPIVQRLSQSIAEVAGLRARIRRETEADLVTLAIAIARRVLRREVSVDPDALQGLAKAALERMQARDVCRVRVHPDHATSMRNHLSDLGVPPGTEIVADTALQSGDLIIETRRGDLDASLESQLREIERGFADRFREDG